MASIERLARKRDLMSPGRVDSHDVGAVDGHGARRQHPARRVHRHDGAAGDDERDGADRVSTRRRAAARTTAQASGNAESAQRRNLSCCDHATDLTALGSGASSFHLPFRFVYSEAVPVILVDHPLVHDTLLGLRDAQHRPSTVSPPGGPDQRAAGGGGDEGPAHGGRVDYDADGSRQRAANRGRCRGRAGAPGRARDARRRPGAVAGGAGWPHRAAARRDDGRGVAVLLEAARRPGRQLRAR